MCFVFWAKSLPEFSYCQLAVKSCLKAQSIKKKTESYSVRLKLCVTLSATEVARELSLAEEALPEGSDSARITLSKTNATACLNVAAAVLNEHYVT